MKFTALALVGSLSAYDFTFACDDHAIVYVDGAAIGENKNWTQASTVSTDNYQEGKSVIAFEGHETYSHGSNKGFIGVLAGRPTDPADWLCKYYKNSNPPSNWKDTSFDDTEWETPISIGINHNPGVDDKAQWMWLDGQKNENSAHVYCRYGGTHGVDPNSELQQKLDKLLSENEGKKVALGDFSQQVGASKEALEQKQQEFSNLKSHSEKLSGDIENIKGDIEGLYDLKVDVEKVRGDIEELELAAEDQKEEHQRLMRQAADDEEMIHHACGEHRGEADRIICTEIWADEHEGNIDNEKPHLTTN